MSVSTARKYVMELKESVERQRVKALLSRPCATQVPLPALGRHDTTHTVERRVGAVWPVYVVRRFQ